MWGFGSIGVGFGSIGVGFGFRAGGGNIAVGLVLAGCPPAGDTGEAEGVSELWEAAVAKEALAGCCFLLSWSFWRQKRQPSPNNRIQKTICLITGGHKSQQSGQNRAGDADGSGSKTKTGDRSRENARRLVIRGSDATLRVIGSPLSVKSYLLFG